MPAMTSGRQPGGKGHRRRRWGTLSLRILLTAVVVYFVARQVARHWAETAAYDWRLDFAWLALSVVLALAALAVFAACWRLLIARFGRPVGVAAAFRISYLSNLGRYIPGKVWQLFGILYLARRHGVQPEEAGASFFLTQLFAIPASLLLFVGAAWLEPRLLVDRVAVAGTGTATALLLLFLGICLLVVFRPGLFLTLGGRLLRRLGRPVPEFTLTSGAALKLFAGYLVGWSLYGLAFWGFLHAVLGAAAPGPVAAVGLYNVAYQVGYLALFAPGGLGPRELVLALVLAPYAGALAPAVAVVARLWSILIEILAAVFALLVGRSHR